MRDKEVAKESSAYGSALLRAVVANQLDVVKKLAGAGANLTCYFSGTQNCSLHCAVQNNNPDMIKILLASGADASHVNKEGKTAIELASQKGYWDCVTAFAETKNDENGKFRYGSALVNAAEANKTDVVEALVAAKATLSYSRHESKNTALHFAVLNNNPEMVKILIKTNANITAKDHAEKDAIQLAAEKSHWECIIAFAEVIEKSHRFSLGAALLIAAKENKTEIVQLLIKTDASLARSYVATGETALFCAVRNNNPDMIKILLASGADASHVNKEGKTAIELASQKGYWDCVTAFAEYKKFQRISFSSPIFSAPVKKAVTSLTSAKKPSEKQKPTEKLETKQSRKELHSLLPATKTLKELIKDKIQQALKGEVDAIAYMAKYYQNKNEYGRAMLFSCIAAVFSILDSEQEEYNTYIKNLIPTKWWSSEDSKNLIAMKSFLRDCLTAKDSLHYLSALKQKYKISDPIVLIFLALEKAIETAPVTLYAEDPGLVKAKGRLNRSFTSAMSKELCLSDSEISDLMAEKRKIITEIIKNDKKEEEENKKQMEKEQQERKYFLKMKKENTPNSVAKTRDGEANFSTNTQQNSIYNNKGITVFSKSTEKPVDNSSKNTKQVVCLLK